MRIEGAEDVEISHVQYSSNWAGAVFSEGAGTFTAVTGTFTVPTPSGSGSASAWVGIDGDSCGNAILQTGIDFNINNGQVSYDAWYEWYPDYAYDFSGISVNAGDQIKLTVTAYSTTSGIAVIENLSNGQQVQQQLTSSSALCEQDAEWIVEDFESGGSLVQLADWGTVTFTDATATTASGSQGPGGAGEIDIVNSSNQPISSVTITDSSVTVTYTGN
ncbi:hypothetical protein CONPUDRAFT_54571 [Coniophora puteana RWD-64-598 SS2]|uniref:Concanavalin A-like lectin glucanase n=1 Tax=Coniophora puteana (strain RWD-64-598) TaxID=741705 RepID=A0A5M3MRP0_CONPW|nr:uncharacterized protein CONPUDRAFT_54571 [Coniophora puteana RWD-64-598 SS2]EIW81822.1 hypothetical protein CONPUDRAFT_54571 [Coniophora puteana RWD-64-598 SS2]